MSTGYVRDGSDEPDAGVVRVADGFGEAISDPDSVLQLPPLDGSRDPLAWRFDLPAATHRGAPLVAGELVIAVTAPDDESTGQVVALDRVHGHQRWQVDVPAAVKVSPALAGDVLVVCDVGGGVTGLDVSDGSVVWQHLSADPCLDLGYAPAVVVGRIVLIGRTRDLRAIDGSTGELLWRRSGLAPDRPLAGRGAPAVVDGVVVHGFWPSEPPLLAFDLLDGSMLWAERRDPSLPQGSMDSGWPLAPLTADPRSGAVVVVSAGSVRSVDAISGQTKWSTPLDGYVNGSPAVLAGDAVLVTVPGVGLTALDRGTGTQQWSYVPNDIADGRVGFAGRGAPVLAPPKVIDEAIAVVPCLDATLRLVDLPSGTEVGCVAVGGAIAAAVVGERDALYVTTVGSQLSRFDVTTALTEALQADTRLQAV